MENIIKNTLESVKKGTLTTEDASRILMALYREIEIVLPTKQNVDDKILESLKEVTDNFNMTSEWADGWEKGYRRCMAFIFKDKGYLKYK
jgi:polyhydroxyalkanoate synthesis regulator phasin